MTAAQGWYFIAGVLDQKSGLGTHLKRNTCDHSSLVVGSNYKLCYEPATACRLRLSYRSTTKCRPISHHNSSQCRFFLGSIIVTIPKLTSRHAPKGTTLEPLGRALLPADRSMAESSLRQGPRWPSLGGDACTCNAGLAFSIKRGSTS